MSLIKKYSLSPSRTILFYMALAITIGTILLSLPLSQKVPMEIIDLFFTATSSICVTGLMSIPFHDFTFFGQIVILILIQIGGLGIITLTFFILSLFLNLGLSSQIMAGELLDLSSWKDMKKILLFIIKLSLVIELIGAFFIFFIIRPHYSLYRSLFYALFHSISCFCNAGLAPFEEGMIYYSHDHGMLIISSFLMIAGGLGFLTWKDLFRWAVAFKEKRRHQLTLQTKIILFYYFIFVLGGTILFWALEHDNTFQIFSLPLQWCNAFFTSVSSRSGGYVSVYLDSMEQVSIFTFMISAFIGAAPGSTGSGVKLTTTAIFIGVINAAISRKSQVTLHNRAIPKDQVYKALSIVALTILWITLITFFLLITEKGASFFSILFESISAFTTLGASLGLTTSLSFLGKILLSLSMFIGRIGSLTLLIALRPKRETGDFSYPEERIMIT